MLAACGEDPSNNGVAASNVSRSTTSNEVIGLGANQPDADGCVLRCARSEDVGIVHRVVITMGGEGYLLMNHGTYNLSTWAPVKNSVLLRRLYNTPGDPVSVTVRITTVALRETRVGDKFASRHGLGIRFFLGFPLVVVALIQSSARRAPWAGSSWTRRTCRSGLGAPTAQTLAPFTREGIVPDILFAPVHAAAFETVHGRPTATASPPA